MSNGDDVLRKVEIGDGEHCHICLKEKAILMVRGVHNRSCGLCGNEILFCSSCIGSLRGVIENFFLKEMNEQGRHTG